jgi:hypothetical protein
MGGGNGNRALRHFLTLADRARFDRRSLKRPAAPKLKAEEERLHRYLSITS